MKLSNGKRFEANFKSSLPQNCFSMRVKDSANFMNHEDSDNFSHQVQSNVCDFIVFYERILFLCECKETDKKSISFQNFKQFELLKAIDSDFVETVLVIRFSSLDETYLVRIFPQLEFDRKSIPIKYCREHGIKIESKLLRVNYRYNLEKAFKDYCKLLTVL